MAIAILTQGKTSIRDSIKTLVTNVTVSDDAQVFAVADTGINPAAAATSTHVGAVTNTNVDAVTFDATITITGASQFTGKSIMAIGLAKGLGIRSATGAGGAHTGGSIVGTDTISRSLRTTGLGIGVQSGDTITVGIRVAVQDNS